MYCIALSFVSKLLSYIVVLNPEYIHLRRDVDSLTVVLGLVRIELIFLTAAHMVLWFRFLTRTALITH